MKKNNCASPLILTINAGFIPGYKTNKSGDQSGEYVDKAIADDLLAALIEATNFMSSENAKNVWNQIKKACDNAQRETEQ